ncbi:hypothetical protein TSAR_004946 [Trichomalopsis sarcophagae]|uniref:Uncharacterized protein n=1 Tax=Trichomalopsis sarcophagae TaxID=543379 RepID=A0A232EHX1_9HYME|nr:hypothetical protein TSAR_004946 [Trichomalopsis sarcophagae]
MRDTWMRRDATPCTPNAGGAFSTSFRRLDDTSRRRCTELLSCS